MRCHRRGVHRRRASSRLLTFDFRGARTDLPLDLEPFLALWDLYLLMDDDEFSHCWERERPRLIRAVFLLSGDMDVAAEIVDEAFVKVFARSQRGGIDDLSGYLWRAVFNETHRQVPRRRRVWPATQQQLERQSHDSRDGAAEAREAIEVRDALWRAAADVDERGRTILVLRYVAGLTGAEVADALEIPVGTVKSSLHRALASLRTALEPTREERR